MQDARESLRTYDQALWRLVQWSISERYTASQLDLAVQVVADVFWVSDEKVRHDLEKRARNLRRAPAPVYKGAVA